MTPRPSAIDTVLLDAGGVLLDLDFAFVRRLLEARECVVEERSLAEAEAEARQEIEKRVRGGGRGSEAWRDYFRFVLGRVHVPGDLHDAVIDVLWSAHQRVGLWTVAVPGAVETVRRLKARGYRLGVVSNAEGRVERDLDGAGFEGLVDAVIDSHLVGVEKPDPKIFAIALDRLGSDASRAIFVGDVPAVDVAGARSAGIAPVLLDRHGAFPDADAPRIGSIEELPAWLDAEVR